MGQQFSIIVPVLIRGWALLLTGTLAWSATAADFAVETEVRDVDGELPQEKILSIFTGAWVIDYVATRPKEVTVLDFDEQCYWRMDPATRTRQRLPLDLLARLTEEASLRALRLPPEIQFAAQPEFRARRWNTDPPRLRLEHEYLTYEAQLDLNVDPDWVARFRGFADWSARLNMLRPGLPPTARLELNREIAARDAVPVQVQVWRRLRSGATESRVSEHRFRADLTPGERDQIEQVARRMANYTEKPWEL